MANATTNAMQLLEASLADDFQVECIDQSDCPVFFAVAMPRRPFAEGKTPRLPCGRGLTRAGAVLSALGEAAELRASLATADTVKRLGDRKRDGLAYLMVENLGSAGLVEVEAQQVFLDWAEIAAEPERFIANSSGCAAWPDLDGATERGLLECIERDARALWWHGKLQCPKRPPHCLDSIQPRLSWWLQQRRRNFTLIDVTCDTGVPAVVAASWEPDGSNIAIGSAAAPMLSEASLSATTEMLQSELAMDIGNVAGNTELQSWTSRVNAHDLPQFAGGISETESPPLTSPVVAHLQALGTDVLRFDFTAQGDVLSAVRMMVPHLGGMRQNLNVQRIMDYNGRYPDRTEVRAVADLDTREPY